MKYSLSLAAMLFIALSGRALAESCERGDADLLVKQCTQVSPATHPPCNTSNPCSLIISEIRRGCAFLEPKERPRFCNAYSD